MSEQRGSPLNARVSSQPSRHFTRCPPHLFSCWDEVESALRAAKDVTLFLDLDGTLTPLRKDPDQVRLDASTQQLLGNLSRHRWVRLSFISGRSRRDLLERIRVPGADYLGLHGLERGSQGPRTLGSQTAILQAKRLLAARLTDVTGIWIEDKGPCFTVHYRGASNRNVRRAHSTLRAVLASFGSAIRVLKGKKVWEVLPSQAHGKGVAVQEVLEKLPRNWLPIYIGDDTTDEYAFAALPHGLTAHVGRPGPTKARYRLRNPAEVIEFLARLNAEMSRYSQASSGALSVPAVRLSTGKH